MSATEFTRELTASRVDFESISRGQAVGVAPAGPNRGALVPVAPVMARWSPPPARHFALTVDGDGARSSFTRQLVAGLRARGFRHTFDPAGADLVVRVLDPIQPFAPSSPRGSVVELTLLPGLPRGGRRETALVLARASATVLVRRTTEAAGPFASIDPDASAVAARSELRLARALADWLSEIVPRPASSSRAARLT